MAQPTEQVEPDNDAAASLPPVAVLSGASSETIQQIIADFAERRRREGVRVAGVIEVAETCDRACDRTVLRDVATGTTVPISQELGRGSESCNLDSDGLARACALVEAAIASGADVVVLSKFGKQEATGHSGLTDAFCAAIAADLPIVTSVSPLLAGAWAGFAGPLSWALPAEAEALEAWWSVRAAAAKLPPRSDRS